jgi:hypothetical protein
MTLHHVYEFYDVDGEPLYVGCTMKLGLRIGQHTTQRDWWPDVFQVVATQYPDVESASAAETALIAELQPRHNTTHNGAKDEARRARAEQGRLAFRERRHELGVACPRYNGCPTCRVRPAA